MVNHTVCVICIHTYVIHVCVCVCVILILIISSSYGCHVKRDAPLHPELKNAKNRYNVVIIIKWRVSVWSDGAWLLFIQENKIFRRKFVSAGPTMRWFLWNGYQYTFVSHAIRHGHSLFQKLFLTQKKYCSTLFSSQKL